MGWGEQERNKFREKKIKIYRTHSENPQMCFINLSKWQCHYHNTWEATTITLGRHLPVSQIYRDLKWIQNRHLINSKITLESLNHWLIVTNEPPFPEREDASISCRYDVSEIWKCIGVLADPGLCSLALDLTFSNL